MTNYLETKKRAEIEANFERVNKLWEFDISKKQFRRREVSGNKKFFQNFFEKKVTPYELYWWAKKSWLVDNKLNAFHFPLEGDSMPVRGLPLKFKLAGGWTIRKRDLKFIINGPLLDEECVFVLVPQRTKSYKIKMLWNAFWGFFGACLTIFGMANLLFGVEADSVRDLFSQLLSV